MLYTGNKYSIVCQLYFNLKNFKMSIYPYSNQYLILSFFLRHSTGDKNGISLLSYFAFFKLLMRLIYSLFAFLLSSIACSCYRDCLSLIILTYNSLINYQYFPNTNVPSLSHCLLCFLPLCRLYKKLSLYLLLFLSKCFLTYLVFNSC